MKPDIIHVKRCDCTDDNISVTCFQATVKVVSRVKDLEARLKAVRHAWFDVAGDYRDPDRFDRITDLRVRKWRKP